MTNFEMFYFDKLNISKTNVKKNYTVVLNGRHVAVVKNISNVVVNNKSPL